MTMKTSRSILIAFVSLFVLVLIGCTGTQSAPTAELTSASSKIAVVATTALESSSAVQPKAPQGTPQANQKAPQQPGGNQGTPPAGNQKAPPQGSNQPPNPLASSSVTVTQQVGLLLNTMKVFTGYTLFAPKHNTATYLIDNSGQVVHSWTASNYEPGQSVYLLENGHLLRTCMTKGRLSTGGGEGGRVEEYDWDGKLEWELDYSTDQYMQHHDIHP
jgi:uncharacterized iron-regulated membrane protein